MTLAQEHTRLTVELVEMIREYGMVRGQIAKAKAGAWAETVGMAVTERRETMTYAASALIEQAEEISADVDALKVELAHVEFMQRVAESLGE